MYSGFTTNIAPLYHEVVVTVKRGVQQEDTESPKLFSVTIEIVMRDLEWEGIAEKTDCRHPQHLRHRDDIMIIEECPAS